MALYLSIEQGLVDVAEKQHPRPFLPRFSFNPFPYLPPELIVSVLSHTPADSIPALDSTNHFFHTHIQIYKRQLIKTRCQEYPVDLLAEYSSIHPADFDSWHQLAKFEKAAETCLSLGRLFGVDGRRFYRAFFRNWESRKSMFFPRGQWQEGLLDRLHIYEDCSRSEICDIVHLQMLYRNLLAQLPWSDTLPAEDPSFDRRVHWSFKSDFYRNLVDQIIACGPEFILKLVSSDDVLWRCVELLRSDDTRFSCFDDVMAKLLTRLDGGSQAATVWQEEESYFDICASTNWFCQTDVRLVPLRNRM